MAQVKQDTPQPVIPVLPGEDPWTPEEIAEVRQELAEEVERMSTALAKAEAELSDLMSQGSDGAGRDSADVSSTNFERDLEMSLNHNARAMLDQYQLALRMMEEGGYGRCEMCGEPIGKGRLQVFPSATMCVSCKQREERQ